MLYATFLLSLMAACVATAPVARPANFETDSMLQVGEKAASSYAGSSSKNANLETDPMLQVGQKEGSSYAES